MFSVSLFSSQKSQEFDNVVECSIYSRTLGALRIYPLHESSFYHINEESPISLTLQNKSVHVYYVIQCFCSVYPDKVFFTSAFFDNNKDTWRDVKNISSSSLDIENIADFDHTLEHPLLSLVEKMGK